MRWLFVVLTACSFDHGALPGHGEAGVTDGPRPIDGRTVDAAIDAPAACLGQSTATFSGHHYFVTQAASWAGTQQTCSAFGGHLVKIETSAEDMFITATFATGGYVWIGLHDPTNTDVYVWTDLTPLGTYNGFTGGIVPAASGNCVDTNGTWDPFGCTSTNHGGVCECE